MALTITPQTWGGQRLRHFLAQWELNGTTLTHNGSDPVAALCPAKEQFIEMTRTDYLGRRQATFTIERTDYLALKLESKDVVESCGSKFMIESVLDDDSEPTVDVKCNLLQ